MVLNNSVFRHTQSKRKVRKTEKKGKEEIMQQCVCGGPGFLRMRSP